MRAKVVTFHRYIGLMLAAFLICSGLTGSVIAFKDQLEIWLNPQLFTIAEAGERSLPASELVAKIEASDPRILVNYLPISQEAEHALIAYVEPRVNPTTSQPYEIDYDEVFVNPVSGEVKGRRMWGECCFESQNIIPFIYKLHNRLLLQKPWGSRILGIVGLFWIVLSLMGIYLTLPRGGTFFKAWKKSWLVQWRHPWRIKFLQLHKSIGLWCWVFMLTTAISGVSMNLSSELFDPIVDTISPYTEKLVIDESALASQKIDFTSALTAAIIYADSNSLPTIPKKISYSMGKNSYSVSLDCDCNTGLGPNTIYIGGASGDVLGVENPRAGSAGDFLSALRLPLHSGHLAGPVGSFVVSLIGLMTALLAIFGVSMWVRKRITP
ncbi:PepSY-associated TM helix domain-containing protein [Dasania marina]|uniref:PepSY-associated TM helix domain-containing protein n=1 Tax=Dasania marina TaxID=471499 RepID=UPI000373E1D0|nr:PepSY-associated TM helix domain-containing protein [Dasania marina]